MDQFMTGSAESAGGFNIFGVFEQIGQKNGYLGHALTSRRKFETSKNIKILFSNIGANVRWGRRDQSAILLSSSSGREDFSFLFLPVQA
jgi:hypothetical protein